MAAKTVVVQREYYNGRQCHMADSFSKVFIPQAAEKLIEEGFTIKSGKPERMINLNNITLYHPVPPYFDPAWKSVEIIRFGYEIGAFGSLGFAAHILQFKNEYLNLFFSKEYLGLSKLDNFYIPLPRTLLFNKYGHKVYCFLKYTEGIQLEDRYIHDANFKLVYFHESSLLDLPIKYLAMK